MFVEEGNEKFALPRERIYGPTGNPKIGLSLKHHKKGCRIAPAAFSLTVNRYSNPFGLFFCQFQLSRHMSSMPYSASQPSSFLALAGSQ